MQKLQTLCSFLLVVITGVANGAELHRVIQSAVHLNSVSVDAPAEEIVVSALKLPTSSPSVDVSTETSSPKIDETSSTPIEESKLATTPKKPPTSTTKKPPVSGAPTSPITTKKPRRTTTTRPPRPIVGASAPIDCSSGIEFWPHTDCDKFIWCIDGEESVHTCTKGLYWDYHLEKCDWPKSVPKDHCMIPALDVSTTTTTSTTPVPPRDCSEDFDYHAHTDCDKFIKCVDGEPQTFHCPGDLYWDDKNELCNWPKQVSQANCKAPAKRTYNSGHI